MLLSAVAVVHCARIANRLRHAPPRVSSDRQRTAPLGFGDADDLCRRLPELAGVVGVPLGAFVREEHRGGYRSLVRFAFCKRAEVLERAAAQLAGLRA